jgi:hypothetical protein
MSLRVTPGRSATLQFAFIALSVISAACSRPSPETTASILVHDSKFGMRAVDEAIAYGDVILDPLERESLDR